MKLTDQIINQFLEDLPTQTIGILKTIREIPSLEFKISVKDQFTPLVEKMEYDANTIDIDYVEVKDERKLLGVCDHMFDLYNPGGVNHPSFAKCIYCGQIGDDPISKQLFQTLH